MIARAFRPTAVHLAGPAGLFCWLALGLAACDKVPLTAPTESTIALFATGSSVPANGSIDIVATVTESSGTAVQNGTVVTFTTTLGSVSPAEARTNNGKVTVKLTGDGRSGTATVTAFSGGTKSDALELPVGAAAADNIIVNASPPSVPVGGGSVQVTAQVRDASGNALAGVPVTFSTTVGTLSQSTVTTDANGQATTTLSTTQSADVTARAGSKEATVTVNATAAPGLTVTVDDATPTVGDAVAFTIGVTVPEGGLPIQSITINYGDGTRQTLGNIGTTVAHQYTAEGTYTVTVRARDTAGVEVTQVLVIVVGPVVTPPVG